MIFNFYIIVLAAAPAKQKGERTMICWHVCSVKKINKYLKTGHINPPVRAWETLEQAQRFSVSTGRRVILRLRLPKNTPKLEGHFNAARVSYGPVSVKNF